MLESYTKNASFRTAFFILIPTLLFVAFLSLSLGPDRNTTLFDFKVWQHLFSETPNEAKTIILQIRLPRLILAILVGGILSVSGLILQNLLQNPLADPYIIGVSGGSGLGAVIVQVLGYHDIRLLTLAAFIGGLAAMIFVERLARFAGRINKGVLILSGVVTNAFFAALISIGLIISGEDMPRIFQWLMGSLNMPDTRMIGPMLYPAVFAALLLWFFSHSLDLIALGEFQAYHLGVNVDRVRLIAIACSSLLTAVAVSLTGMIGFIGMFVPHSVRFIFGGKHKVLIPASFFTGAILLTTIDTLIRLAPSGLEMPVGALTALLGAPFFLFLLLKNSESRIV